MPQNTRELELTTAIYFTYDEIGAYRKMFTPNNRF